MNVDGSVVSHPQGAPLMLNFKSLKQIVDVAAPRDEGLLLLCLENRINFVQEPDATRE
jgi:hypothetical protein